MSQGGPPPFISWEALQLPSLAWWVPGQSFTELLALLPSLSQVIPLLRDFPLPLRDHLELALGHLQPPRQGGLQGLEQKPQGLFHVLLQSQEQPCPWRHLLAASVKHHLPILSVLAAGFQVRVLQDGRPGSWGDGDGWKVTLEQRRRCASGTGWL